MQPLVNRTVLTFERMCEFNKRHMAFQRPFFIVAYSVILCIGVLLLGLTFALALLSSSLSNINVRWLIASLVFIGLSVYSILRYTVLLTLAIRKSPALDTVSLLRFTEYGMEAVADSPIHGVHSEDRLPYSSITRVTESEGAYYLYFSRQSAFTVAKDGFIEGSEADFRALLFTKIDPKKIKIH